MSILTFIGLGLDLFGALLLVIGDPPAHNTFLLRLRYIADKYHPTVAKVKNAYDALSLGCLIYENGEDAISEKPLDRIESTVVVRSALERFTISTVLPSCGTTSFFLKMNSRNRF